MRLGIFLSGFEKKKHIVLYMYILHIFMSMNDQIRGKQETKDGHAECVVYREPKGSRVVKRVKIFKTEITIAIQCSKLRIYSMHRSGAWGGKSMHLAIFSCAHFYITILKIFKKHAPAGCTGPTICAPGHQNVHTSCRVHH